MKKLSKEASVGGLLVFGTTTSSLAKLVYELQSVGLNGETKHFKKPWAMTAVMFLGMSLCLPLAYQSDEKELTVLGTPASGSNQIDWDVVQHEIRESLLISIPAGFDLVATVLMNVGLLSVTASVFQMLRGACMLFAALFAVVFLKRRLNGLHFTGISLAIAGIALVGFSSMLASGSGFGAAGDLMDSNTVLMGMGLIVLSQAAQAAQITCEDYLMRTKGVSPLKIVGWEGVYGFLAMVLVMLPAAHFIPGVEGQGLHEDLLDTIQMVMSSHTLQTVLAVDMVAFLAYNISGMSVTEHYGGVYRSVLETLRTLFVWMVSLGLYYSMDGQVGEAWTPFSHLQAAGFAVLVGGTMLYGRGNTQRLQEEEQERQQLQEQLEQLAAEEALAVANAGPATTVESTVNPGSRATALTSTPLPTFKQSASTFDSTTGVAARSQGATQTAATRTHVRARATHCRSAVRRGVPCRPVQGWQQAGGRLLRLQRGAAPAAARMAFA